MKSFKNLSVRSKIMLGYTIALVLIFVVGGVALFRLNQINTTVTDLAEDVAVDQQLTAEIGIHLLTAHLLTNRYILSGFSEVALQFTKEVETLDKLFERADREIDRREQAEKLAEIKADFQTYKGGFADIVGAPNEITVSSINTDAAFRDLSTQADLKLFDLIKNAFENGDTDVLYHASRVQSALLRMRASVHKYLIRTQEPALAGAVDLHYEQVQRTFEELERTVQDPIQRELVEDAKTLMADYHQNFQEGRESLAQRDEIVATKLDVLGPQIQESTMDMLTNAQTDFQVAEGATRKLVVQTRWLLLGTMIMAIALGLGLGFVLQRHISEPIIRLTSVANQIAAGDMTVQTPVESDDEIGQLAAVFNTMTQRLRGTIESLEQQTRQLETVVETSQQLTGILELNVLLHAVVTIIKETFNYYHAHIYLIEDERLILAEGYGQAGAKMKQQGHSIPLSAPQSLVARAAREKQVITVENTLEDPTWLFNPLLPDTHAEMAVPVMWGQEVLGVLDVQSERVGGLTSEDATMLQALASQVAVAVRNAQAFRHTQDALAEVQRLQRLYTGEAWEKFSHLRPTTNYEVRQPTLPPLPEIATPEAVTALQHRQTVDLRIGGGGDGGSDGWSELAEGGLATGDVSKESSGLWPESTAAEYPASFESALATPLRLGEDVIGVLGIRDDDPDRRWTEEEIALIEAVSEQMSLAIENARLFEETGRRAGRERVIADIIRRIWASNELEQVMQTAVEQLGQTLDASKVIIRLGTADQLITVPAANGDDASSAEKEVGTLEEADPSAEASADAEPFAEADTSSQVDQD